MPLSHSEILNVLTGEHTRTVSGRFIATASSSSSVPWPVMQIWRQHIFQLKRWITRVITFLENLCCEYARGWSSAACSHHYIHCSSVQGGWRHDRAVHPIDSNPSAREGEQLLHLWQANTMLGSYSTYTAFLAIALGWDKKNNRSVWIGLGFSPGCSQDNISRSHLIIGLPSSIETVWIA